MITFSKRPADQSRALSVSRRTLALCAVVVSSGLALTACSSTHPATMSKHAAVALPSKNIDQWSLPLDGFELGDTRVSSYAEQLLEEPCVEKAGYSFDVPYMDLNATQGASFNAVGRRLFNESIAEKWGYHLAPIVDSTFAAETAFGNKENAIGGAEGDAIKSCIRQARAKLPALPLSAQLASEYAAGAYKGALASQPVLAAIKKWKVCMLPTGYSDLSTPDNTPSDSMTNGLDITGDTSTVAPVVSAKEISVATRDAKCQSSTGYEKTFYEQEWSRQTALLDKNADALIRVKAEIAKYDAQAQKIVVANAPRN